MNEAENMAMNAIGHAASMVQATWQEAGAEYMRPSVKMRPKLSIDGNQWCALYGDDLQSGVAGFGDSPNAAMYDFDTNWLKSLVQGRYE
jgi:hypothetical protein